MPAHGPGQSWSRSWTHPIGPLSLLAHDGALVGGGFTDDPAELHVRMHPSLRALELTAGPSGRPGLAGQAGARLLRR